MSFSRRNRIISVRVSEEEYEQVERISREHRARSVSDFVRWLLASSGLTVPTSEPNIYGIQEQVAALQRRVDWLSDLVTENRGQGRSASTDTPLGEQCLVSVASALCESAQE